MGNRIDFVHVSYRRIAFLHVSMASLVQIFGAPGLLASGIKAGSACCSGPQRIHGIPTGRKLVDFRLLLVSLAVATIGEELWWRGYILPRQELAHGQGTWFVHGVLWCLFHLFAPWNVLSILPGCLALSFVAQRLKNTWPAIIAHGLANGLLVLIVVVAGILGA